MATKRRISSGPAPQALELFARGSMDLNFPSNPSWAEGPVAAMVSAAAHSQSAVLAG